MAETDKIQLVQIEAEGPTQATAAVRSATWYKVVLCGSPDVGKTSIYTRIKDNKFETNGHQKSPQECTVNVTVDGAEIVKIYLVDTMGLERHAALTRPHYKDSHAVLVVYSTDNKKSFDDVRCYMKEAREYEPGVPLFLIRNKIDLEELEETVVSQEQENDQYLHSTDFKFRMRVSAKTGEGIEDLVNRLTKFLLINVKRGSAERRKTIKIAKAKETSNKRGCARC